MKTVQHYKNMPGKAGRMLAQRQYRLKCLNGNHFPYCMRVLMRMRIRKRLGILCQAVLDTGFLQTGENGRGYSDATLKLMHFLRSKSIPEETMIECGLYAYCEWVVDTLGTLAITNSVVGNT